MIFRRNTVICSQQRIIFASLCEMLILAFRRLNGSRLFSSRVPGHCRCTFHSFDIKIVQNVRYVRVITACSYWCDVELQQLCTPAVDLPGTLHVCVCTTIIPPTPSNKMQWRNLFDFPLFAIAFRTIDPSAPSERIMSFGNP